MADWWRTASRELRAQGWELSQTSQAHWRCKPPFPDEPIVHVATSSRNCRTIENYIAELKRRGYVPGLMDAAPEPSAPPAAASSPCRPNPPPDATLGYLFENRLDLGLPIVGLSFRRIDRDDPRDPKTVISWTERSVVLLCADGQRVKMSARNVLRDLKKGNYRLDGGLEQLDRDPDWSRFVFHEALRCWRQRQMLTIADLAELVGADPQMLRALEDRVSAVVPGNPLHERLLQVFPGLQHTKRLLSHAAAPPSDPLSEPTSEPTPPKEITTMPSLSQTIRDLNEGAFKHADKALRDAGHGDIADALAAARDHDETDFDAFLTLTWDLARDLHGDPETIGFSRSKAGAWSVKLVTKEKTLSAGPANAKSAATPLSPLKGIIHQLSAELSSREERLRQRRQRLEALFGSGP